MQTIINFFKNILKRVFGLLWWEIRKLNFVAKDVTWAERTGDFVEVFKSTRVYLLFNLLAFLVFFKLPQGKDVLLIVTEDIKSGYVLPLFSLLFGLTIWCVISEFGVRYKIYVTDNSGKSLSSDRVIYRKQLQKFIYLIYLLLPIIIVFISIVIIGIVHVGVWDWQHGWPYLIVLALLLLLFSGLLIFYADEKFIKKIRASNFTTFRLLKLHGDEAMWTEKLYGIYNDYVFYIRFKSFYKSPDTKNPALKNAYDNFIQAINDVPHHEDNNPQIYYRDVTRLTINNDKETVRERVGFPDEYIADIKETVPLAFGGPIYKPKDYKDVELNDQTNKFEKIETENGSYRWIYVNNPALFKTLHKQIRIIFSLSFIFILLISFTNIPFSSAIGSPGLVCLSFGCWLGIITGLLYVDSRYKNKLPFSVRWLLIFWFFLVSYINNDHPVRVSTCNKPANQNERVSIDTHFNKWFANNKKLRTTDTFHIHSTDSFYKYFGRFHAKDTTKPDSIVYPVIFITAEGGALRTGAFTSLLLSRLQDSIPNFKNDIYAFSSVSGGTVGVGLYNALAYLQPDMNHHDTNYYANATKTFFTQDQLSPVLAKLFYGDILNYFIPWQIPIFDRATSLEKAWELSYYKIFNKAGEPNVFSSDFISAYKNQQQYPAWFINTTEVETGLQCYVSNIKADSFLFSNQRDLLSNKLCCDINYSTAIGFSTRFPIISPSAAVKQDDNVTYHYVDGGYVENTGAKTMLEVLQHLRDSLRSNYIIPIVIQLRFGEDGALENTGFLNEFSSIASGIYNIRGGYSQTYSKQLQTYTTDTLKGYYANVPLNASANDVPLNWVLSDNSWNILDSAVKKIATNTKSDLHNSLYRLFINKSKK